MTNLYISKANRLVRKFLGKYGKAWHIWNE